MLVAHVVEHGDVAPGKRVQVPSFTPSRRSSMVEHSPVQGEVAGSVPAVGASEVVQHSTPANQPEMRVPSPVLACSRGSVREALGTWLPPRLRGFDSRLPLEQDVV